LLIKEKQKQFTIKVKKFMAEEKEKIKADI